MAARNSRGKETSPYFGVQKREGRYVAEMRHVKLGKFYHRYANELEAAFFIDAINHFVPNKKNYSYNSVNGQRVLTECRSQYQQDLDELLARPLPTEQKSREYLVQEIKSSLVRVVDELWKTHHEDISKDHVRPSSRQFIQGECGIEKETEDDISRNTDNQGLSAKFDVDGGLVFRAPMEEGTLKKNVLLPPALEEHQVSNSDTQIIQHEGIDGSGAMRGESLDNMVPHMTIRCAEYKNWLEVATKFLASCSKERVLKLLFPEIDPMLKLCETRQYSSELWGPQFVWMHESQQGSQCALYEQIYDIVTEFIDSECPPEEINRFQAETGPIIQRCRANWHY